jgi:hypothetical protein
MSSAPSPVAKVEINKAKSDPPREVEVNCGHLWSLAQSEAIKRLSTYRKEFHLFGDQKWMLECDFSTRAARIAGVYASFYLETESGGNEAFKGRFYWMGLAAFASKQVMCGLDFTKLVTYAWPITKPVVDIGKNGLGKGNFWLFQDIFCWHWFYSQYPRKFEKCSIARNIDKFEAQIKNAVRALPWAQESLSVIDNFKIKDEITDAFFNVSKAEEKPPGKERQGFQYKSLIATANHEQLNILQPLIYEDPVFKKILDVQKASEGVPLMPLRSAAFSTACDVKEPELREQMDVGDLYSAQNRMEFIQLIADKYHGLMINRKGYMEGMIAEISGWRNRT